jgi:hypothetical protein
MLCAGLALRPGVQDRAGACVGVIKAITTFGKIDEAIYDRGYSTAKPDNLARPLHDLGIALTFDLHASQRGLRAGPTPETIWVDGTLYSNALPEPLRDLEPPAIGDSPSVKAHRRDVFAARDAYAFVRHSKPIPGRHGRRFKGPALAGHVRCPNVPASMRLGHNVPTTTCVRGTKCGCGITVSISDSVYERDRQHLPWQSHAWAASYNRRTRIEGLNAQIRFQDLNVNRGFFRMLGRTATMLLLAVTLAGYNATHLHDWYVGRGLPEPWAVDLGEPAYTGALRRYTRTRGRSSHAPPNGDSSTATPTTE